MSYLPYIVIAIFFVLSMKDKTYALCFYLICRFIFPPIVRMGPLSMNSVMSVFMVGYILLYYWKLKEFEKSLFFPLTKFAIPLAIVSLFGVIPLSFAYKSLLQFILTEIVPGLFLVTFIKNIRDAKSVFVSIGISYIIIGLWGIVTYLIKMNPLYSFFVLNYAGGFEVFDWTGDGEGSTRGGLVGTATGNLNGPLPWGQESMLIALFFLFLGKNKIVSSKFSFLIVVLAIANAFLSGKRSCLLPLIIAVFYLLWIKRFFFDFKKIIVSLSVLVILLVVIFKVPAFEQFGKNIETTVFFWDDKVAAKNDVGGSNKEMRFEQFIYVHKMVSDNLLGGLGFGYPTYYSTNYGIHPYMLGFESIYFLAMASSGLIGVLIWTFFFVKMFKISCRVKSNLHFTLAFHGGFILSCIFTSIQASFWIYLLLSFLYVITFNKSKIHTELNNKSI